MAMQLNQHLYKNAIIMAKNNSITGGRCMSSKIFDKNSKYTCFEVLYLTFILYYEQI